MLNSANCPSYAFTMYTEGKNQLQLYFMAYPNQVYHMIHLCPFYAIGYTYLSIIIIYAAQATALTRDFPTDCLMYSS